MKHSKKVVSVLLAGTLAFSSIGVAPMVAFADAGQVQQDQATDENRTLEVVDGLVQDPLVDENGDPIIVAEAGYSWRLGDRYDRRFGYNRGYVGDVIVLGGPYNAAVVRDNGRGYWNTGYVAVNTPVASRSVVVSTDTRNYRTNSSTWCFYAPTSNRRAVDCYAYGNLYYPNSIAGYTRYNGNVSFDLYKEYAIQSVKSVQKALNNVSGDAGISERKKTVDNALSIIEGASSWSVIEEQLWKVKDVADWYGIPMYTDWYLPYDYTTYCGNWRNYDWRWDYRPSDCRSSSSSYKEETKTVTVYRLLNPANGDHVYNSSSAVREKLIADGWKNEGTAWKALETSSKPVYQLHNTVTGRYHYTTNTTERDNLVADKWDNDGVAFYSSGSGATKVYRVLNPVNGSHFFTKSTTERNDLVKAGWQDEGVAFYVGK